MCRHCESGFYTIIESDKLHKGIIGWCKEMLATELWDIDNSVVLQVQNGHGYIRLGDRQEMGCLDHCDIIKIQYCPFCGHKFEQ